MSARKHARRIVNRRRAKRIAGLREVQEINAWIVAMKASAVENLPAQGR